MPVNYSPLESKSGFVSNNFSVDSAGNLTAEAITGAIITADTIILNGVPLAGSGGGPAGLELDGNFIVAEGSTPYISIINGQVQITNRSDSIGSIDNVDIGVTTPAIGIFTDLTSDGDINFSPIATKTFIINPADIGTIDNVNIGVTTEGTGRFSSLILTSEATQDDQVSTKGYVDTRINVFSAAFSIALGS